MNKNIAFTHLLQPLMTLHGAAGAGRNVRHMIWLVTVCLTSPPRVSIFRDFARHCT